MKDSIHGSMKPRGLSLATRSAIVALFFIFVSDIGIESLLYFGLPAFGYQGRRALIHSKSKKDLNASGELKRSNIETWFRGRVSEAKAVSTILLSSGDLDRLLSASLGGWDDRDLKATGKIGALLAAISKSFAGTKAIEVAEARSGRLLASSTLPPFGRAEDVSWLSAEPAMRLNDKGEWVLGVPGSSPAGAPLAVLLYLDVEALFDELAENPLDRALNLDSAILDKDLRVVLSSRPARFAPGLLPLPLRQLDLLRKGEMETVVAEDGRRLDAQLFYIKTVSSIKIHLIMSADVSMIEKTLFVDRLASSIIGAVCILLGLLATWWVLRRIFKPLKSLAAAIEAFSSGKAPLPLPLASPGDIGLIAVTLGELMDRVQDWRKKLEAEVEARTGELELRRALAWVFVHEEQDDQALHSVLGLLAKDLEASGGIILYREGPGTERFISSKLPASVPGSKEEESLLTQSVHSPGIPYSGLGFSFRNTMARSIEVGAEQGGIVLLGRDDRAFSESESELFKRLVEELAAFVLARAQKARQNTARLGMERSLRRNEEKLRTFFEESRDMIYTANADDIVASVNYAGLALLGRPDYFEVVGWPFSKFALAAEDRAFFLSQIKEQGFVADFEIVLKRADGTLVYCIETAHAVKDKQGALVEVQGIVKDISERIKNERELWKANLELAEVNANLKNTQMLVIQQEKLASIGQLSAGIAHEINNPLGFLKSNHLVMTRFFRKLKTACDEVSAIDPEVMERIVEEHELGYVFSELGTIITESDEGYRRIMDIVSNLKSFARSEMDPGVGPFNLNKSIESTLVVARNEIKYVADVELRLGELPQIEAVGGEINQVLLNTLVNAAQAIESQKRKEKGRILVETHQEKERVVCIISDDGPGIPEGLRLKIFDPFFTTKEPGKGTGLGLSISYDIVVIRHGGKLTVGTSAFGGAEFRIELPLYRLAPNQGSTG